MDAWSRSAQRGRARPSRDRRGRPPAPGQHDRDEPPVGGDGKRRRGQFAHVSGNHADHREAI
eukprot:7592610-Pyramimonas_sp.AAC.1